MAIRDHFRLDVLVRRAAVLQERDAELAELERLLRLEESASAGSCPHCAAPHSRGALFCWQCGATLMERSPSTAARRHDGGEEIVPTACAAARARRTPRHPGAASHPRSRRWATRAGPMPDCGAPLRARSALLRGLWRRDGARSPLLDQAAGGAPASAVAESRGRGTAKAARAGDARRGRAAGRARAPTQDLDPRRGSPPRRPRSPPFARVSALLVLVFLGFGVIVGDAAGSPRAATRSPRPRGRREAGPSAGRRRVGLLPTALVLVAFCLFFERRTPSAAPEPTPAASPSKQHFCRQAVGLRQGLRAVELERLGKRIHRPAAGGSPSKLPPVKHVFVITLSDQPYASVFGPASSCSVPVPDARAARRAAGALLRRRPPGAAPTRSRCSAARDRPRKRRPTVPTYARHRAGERSAPTSRSMAAAACTRQRHQTLAGQLTAKHLTWRAYVEGMDEAPAPGRPARIRRSGSPIPPPPSAAGRTDLRDLPQSVRLLPLGDRLADVRRRRRRPEAAELRPGRTRAHTELLLHRARPLPRRNSRRPARPGRRRGCPRPTASWSTWSRRSSARRPTRTAGCS